MKLYHVLHGILIKITVWKNVRINGDFLHVRNLKETPFIVATVYLLQTESPIKHLIYHKYGTYALASAILLPFEIIDRGMFLFGIDGKIKTLNKIYFPKVYEQFSNLAAFLGVSKTALAIRMKQLGLLENNHLDNPYCLIDVDYNGSK
ncbi:hypothetical protein SDC9_155714 [bioreactor metagenome]|uniref:IrrE N-terminal-like domain-containing protein n=1 Tax=bioreactor metagenome TaxID=1076179 RepID=A0A645F4I7_9ZZZZ|nr:hypothetical protein [Oscillospiraceae bacterium]